MSLAGTQNPRAQGQAVQAAQPARQAWSPEAILALFELPFNDLLHRAHTVHRQHFDANTVQFSTLLSVKTGGCPEDCAYCPQSARYDTGVEASELLPVDSACRRRGARRRRAQHASAWVRRGAGRRIASSSRCWRWSRA